MTARRFTTADVARACKGAMTAGLPVARVEIDPVTCKIVVIIGVGAAPSTDAEPNEWDGATNATAKNAVRPGI
nr:hypothetical protein [uncultured Dongia sp.]